MPIAKVPPRPLTPPRDTTHGYRVAVVGGTNMDISAQALMVPVAGDSTPGTVRCAPGGVARNVAENLSRLGLIAHLVSVVGDDAFGAMVLEATDKAGVDVGAVKTLPGQRTATYVSLHGPDGDAAMAVNDMAILELLGPDSLVHSRNLLVAADCIVLDCNLSSGAIGWIMAQSGLGPVFVDGVSVAKCQRINPWLNRIHLLKVNAMEAQALTGVMVQCEDDARRAAVHLHQSGVNCVVVSLGQRGLCWCDEDGLSGHRPAHEQVVASTSGAGDALLAGLVHACTVGLDWPQAIDFAMACASITLDSPYANAPDLSLSAVQSALAANAGHAAISN